VSGTNGAIRAALARAAARPFTAADIGEWRAGWRIVLGAGVGLGTGIAFYLMVASLFIKRMTEEFGWSRGDMGLAGMLAFAVAAVSLSVIGKIIDRYGFRSVVMVCAPGIALLYIGIALQPGSFAVYLALMVWGGIVGGGTGAIVYTRPVIGAFARQRGLALGAATCGVSFASILLAPLLAQVIADHGWRSGFYAMAGVLVFVGAPAALALIASARESGSAGVPHALSESPTHQHVEVLEERAGRPRFQTASDARTGPDVTIGQALRGAPFWLIVAALVAINVPGSGFVGQLAPLVTDKGLSEVASGAVMSVYALGLLGGRLVTGFALDRLSAPMVAAALTLVPAFGMALLLIPTASFALAAFAALLIGVQQGSEVDIIAYFVARRFGISHYGAIYGRIATFGAVGTAIGLVLFGEVHDATGTYDWALVLGAAAFTLGACAFAALARVR
jgi:sugar phosphate permease